MKIDEAFAEVNDYGIFQKIALPFLGISGAFHGMQTSSANFISGQPERWCKIEQLQNFSYQQQKNIAIPQNSEGDYDNCNAFNLQWDDFSLEEFVNWNRSEYTDTPTVPCDEFVYSKDTFSETSISKWDLVCSEAFLGEMISTFYVVGLFLGSSFSGRISDMLGRKTVINGLAFLTVIALFAAAFVPNAIAFLMLRLLIGFSTRGFTVSATVLMLEIAGPNQRELAGTLTPGSFSFGVMICSGCAYALRDFQYLHIVMGGFAFSYFLVTLLMPESPRWLLAKGKVEKAEKTMRWIGKVNNKPLPEDFQLTYKEVSEDGKREKMSYFDVFRYPVLRKHVLILHFLWIAGNFSYTALSLNIGSLSGSTYVNVFLSGATELPAQIACLLCMRYLGRKKAYFIFAAIFVGGNAAAIPMELIPSLRVGASICTIIARAGASTLTSITQTITAELFPTAVRQTVLGLTIGIAAAVGISGPYLGGTLKETFRPLPNIIYGSLGAVAIVLAMFLPETMGQGLPDTVEEAINMGKRRSKKSESSESSVPSVSGSIQKPGEMEMKDCVEVDPESQIDGLPNKAYEADDNEPTSDFCGNTDSITDYTYVVHL